MFRNLILVSLFASTNIMASSITTSKMYQIPDVSMGKEFTANSQHTYQITNDTDAVQSIEFCHQIATCVEWPYYVKAQRQCENFNLTAHENKSGVVNMDMKISYPFLAECTAVASSEIKGGTYHISSDQVVFKIGH